jgi:hypothetical protein
LWKNQTALAKLNFAMCGRSHATRSHSQLEDISSVSHIVLRRFYYGSNRFSCCVKQSETYIGRI